MFPRSYSIVLGVKGPVILAPDMAIVIMIYVSN
jgi:hypothetical protein